MGRAETAPRQNTDRPVKDKSRASRKSRHLKCRHFTPGSFASWSLGKLGRAPKRLWRKTVDFCERLIQQPSRLFWVFESFEVPPPKVGDLGIDEVVFIRRGELSP